MTAVEVFELTTKGGATDFGRVIEIAQRCGPCCLIGGLAVNCYVEPVYTVDAHFAVASADSSHLERELSVTVSSLRIQFAKDPRYNDFPSRSVKRGVLGIISAQIACLDDLVQGKLWAYTDPARRFSKRKKDELDLVRLAEAYPHLVNRYPQNLRDVIESN